MLWKKWDEIRVYKDLQSELWATVYAIITILLVTVKTFLIYSHEDRHFSARHVAFKWVQYLGSGKICTSQNVPNLS